MDENQGQGHLADQLGMQTRRIVEALRLQRSHQLRRSSIALPENGQLVGIVGERGSGKTTLLRSVYDAAQQDGEWVVLPVLRPEVMPDAESVLISVIGQLVRVTVAQPDLFSSRDAMAEIEQLSQGVLRAALYLGRHAVGEVLTQSPSLGQFAADSASVLLRGSTFIDDLQFLVARILHLTGRRGVIVGVDDIDLIPGKLAQLLSDVRLIGSCPGVLPVLCLSWNDLRGNLRAEMMRSYPSLDAASLEKSVTQQVMKTMRPDRIFEPLQLPRNRRLDFTPIDAEDSLGSILLSLFRAMEGAGREPLGNWLKNQVGTDERHVLGFAWLPDTFRGLEHLYYAALSLTESLSGNRSALEVGQQLRQMVSSVSREATRLDVNLEVQSGGLSEGSPGLVAVADWPKITVGVQSTSDWKRVFQNSGTRILIREVVRPIATQVLTDTPSTPEVNNRHAMSIRDISAALLVQSLLSTSVFEDPPPAGPLAIVDDSCIFLQSIRIVGLDTDDSFFFLPPSSGIVLVDRWSRTWNWIVATTEKYRETEAPGERLLASICEGVVHVWFRGSTPDASAPAMSAREAFDLASRVYVEIAGLAGADDQWQWNPRSAYCVWYETLLPKAFHEALLSQSLLGAILEQWQAALSSGMRAEGAMSRLRDSFTRRLGSDSAASKSAVRSRAWLFGYRPLLSNVSSDLAILLKDYEKEYVERGGRGSKGRDVVEETVSLVESASRYQFATHKTAESIAEEDLLRRVLAQLRP